jgi:hypothetical protein
LEALDAGLVPIVLVAVTVKVYAVPLASPGMVIGAVVPEALCPPGLDVTAYSVIGLPPFEAGAEKLTVATAMPAFADTSVGAPGTVAGVTPLEGLDGGPVPITFVAVTVKV